MTRILLIVLLALAPPIWGFEHYPDKIKWTKTEIKWSTDNEAYSDDALAAFQEWSAATNYHLTFTKVQNDAGPDIRIQDSTDEDTRFLGFSGITRKDGAIVHGLIKIHTTNSKFYRALILHEIGHVLGLEHCNIKRAAMWSVIDADRHTLHKDDVEGICALYGLTPIMPDFFVGVTRIRGKKYRFESSVPILYTFPKDALSDLTTEQDFRFRGRYPFSVVADYNGWIKTIVIQHPKKKR